MNHVFKITLILCGLMLTMVVSPLAMGQTSESEILGDLLFPSSADWLKLSGLKKMSKDHLAEVKPELNSALPPAFSKDDQDITPCLTERVWEQADSFYIADVNSDEVEDVVFSGYFPCGESSLSIIWYGGGEGGYTVGEKDIEFSYILKLKPQPNRPLKLT
ncbi:hypothetical protein C4J81_00590 [Deltaproteobacteria bacterium Smac51]|nr:hypothetical protein C4J81_00590 [Deltaproteobacteria bacterium Smac51]